ncbi:MAG: hypothetical protein HKL90_06120 [Elusimicrobia bacterium]|nr:hypothetical protein [Elusimicrobiota bacterium]
MNAAALSLAVLTLNVAGPRRALQDWPARRAVLAAALKSAAPDVAALQEIWLGRDVAALAQAESATDAAADSALGLAILLRGRRASEQARLDLGGGFGALVVAVGDGRRIFDAYCVRLESGGAARRLGQLFRLAEFVRARSAGRPFVLLGGLGAAADDKDAALFLDLLEGRDLCVAHGDEVCAGPAERRESFVVIPYSSREPRPAAVFPDRPSGEEDAPLTPSFGLRARLDGTFFKLQPAAQPPGRVEALTEVADAVDNARVDAQAAEARAGWIPFWGTLDALRARDRDRRLAFLREEVRSAQIRAARAGAAP